jgi:hypothetical protein
MWEVLLAEAGDTLQYSKPVVESGTGAGFGRFACNRGFLEFDGSKKKENKIRGMSASEEAEGKVDRKGRSSKSFLLSTLLSPHAFSILLPSCNSHLELKYQTSLFIDLLRVPVLSSSVIS